MPSKMFLTIIILIFLVAVGLVVFGSMSETDLKKPSFPKSIPDNNVVTQKPIQEEENTREAVDSADVLESEDDKNPFPYYSKRPLTKSEQVLYFQLLQTFPEYIILPQVGLSRFIAVKKGHNFGQWFNRINRMSVDYLICSKDFLIVAAIELDDPSHEKEERIVADTKKNKALASAGVRLIRWKVSELPCSDAMRKDVLKWVETDKAV